MLTLGRTLTQAVFSTNILPHGLDRAFKVKRELERVLYEGLEVQE